MHHPNPEPTIGVQALGIENSPQLPRSLVFQSRPYRETAKHLVRPCHDALQLDATT